MAPILTSAISHFIHEPSFFFLVLCKHFSRYQICTLMYGKKWIFPSFLKSSKSLSQFTDVKKVGGRGGRGGGKGKNFGSSSNYCNFLEKKLDILIIGENSSISYWIERNFFFLFLGLGIMPPNVLFMPKKSLTWHLWDSLAIHSYIYVKLDLFIIDPTFIGTSLIVSLTLSNIWRDCYDNL